jgi:hypothetical protein
VIEPFRSRREVIRRLQALERQRVVQPHAFVGAERRGGDHGEDDEDEAADHRISFLAISCGLSSPTLSRRARSL